MTGIYAQAQIQPLPSVPDIGQLTVEVSQSETFVLCLTRGS